ncbi:MAG: MlrC C-terminal domain-containing protein, partial [Roseibium sp.]|uniref:MlrC C-terminal domain-containing protein n=1 Tax=Roseibium sp. TaxID=1936156 RepID=UPI00260A9159
LTIGGAFGSCCPRVTAEVVVGKKFGTETEQNREVMVHIAGNSIILTERRRPFHNLNDFERFGIAVEETAFLIVKSGYLSPELAPLANPARMALTDGAVNQGISSLKNDCRPDPSYPFQLDFNWSPKARISGRAAMKGTQPD